jgi:hypothetical protein
VFTSPDVYNFFVTFVIFALLMLATTFVFGMLITMSNWRQYKALNNVALTLRKWSEARVKAQRAQAAYAVKDLEVPAWFATVYRALTRSSVKFSDVASFSFAADGRNYFGLVAVAEDFKVILSDVPAARLQKALKKMPKEALARSSFVEQTAILRGRAGEEYYADIVGVEPFFDLKADAAFEKYGLDCPEQPMYLYEVRR